MPARGIRKIWQRFPRPLVIALIVIFGYFLYQISRDLFNYRELVLKKELLLKDKAEKSAGIKSFAKEIAFLRGVEGVEYVAREKLGLVKRGETAYKVVFK